MDNNPNQRKKRVVSGTGNVHRRDDKPVSTNGPVGRKDGYQGRRTQFGGQSQNTQQTFIPTQQQTQQNTQQSGGAQRGAGGGKLLRILLLVAVIVVAIILIRTCVCRGSGCATMSLPGIEPGGDEYGTQQGSDPDLWSVLSNQYDASDSTAENALSATTSYTNANYTVSNKARDRYTTIRGNGKDIVTVMVYICGSDLESEHGMATADLNEMLHAKLDDEHVNIIVETGGAKKWNNSVISAKTNQRYRVTSRGLQVLDRDVGRRSMVDPNTLVDFIQFCKTNYPANRNMLILWDHGGGAISGYGYDQTASGSMMLDKINAALKKGGVQFDFIGFDACLMATLETAVVTEPYADYLIASEETEPGSGWYYTNWLSELSKNTSINTVELSKTLIDDFNNVSKKNYPGCNTTLSIVDLAEFSGTVPTAFNAFSGEVSELLDNSDFKQIADARANTHEYGASAKVNHVDLIDLANRIGGSEANALTKALSGCIKYNRTSVSMKNSNGLSIYFPYSSFKGMNSAVKLYDSIGMDADYSRCISSFASLAAGGQIATGGTTSSPLGSLLGSYSDAPSFSSGDMLSTLLGSYLGGSSSSGSNSGAGSILGSLLGGSSSSPTDFLGSILGSDSSSWFDSGRVLRSGEYYDENRLTVQDMLLTEKAAGEYVLSLSEEQWKLVEKIQKNVFVQEDDHYIDLGMDDQWQKDDDGDLPIEFDNTWMSLDNQVVAFYIMDTIQDGSNWATVGRVPAMLNGERVDIMIVFDNETEEHEYGYVAGAQRVYDGSETETVAKGLIPLKKGDRIDFLCDCYYEDGTYDASYYLGEPMICDGDLLVGYIDLGDAVCDVTYCLTDLYGNEFWTESLTFE